MAWYEDGAVAAVSHRYGKGRTLLIGTHPSIHCHKKERGINRSIFGDLQIYPTRTMGIGPMRRFSPLAQKG